MTIGLSRKKLIVDLVDMFTGMTQVPCAWMRLSEKRIKWDVREQKTSILLVQRPVSEGERETEILHVLKAHILLY